MIPTKEQRIKCVKCFRELQPIMFYKSNSKMLANNRSNVCKVCTNKMIDVNNLETVYKVLQLMDIAFIKKYWDVAKNANTEKSLFGNYLRMANSGLNEFKNAKWANSVFEWNEDALTIEERLRLKLDFILTDDIMEFFGSGFTEEEYSAMYRKYNFLKNNYPEKTNMHIEALKTFVRYKVKEEMAIAKNSVGEAEKWGKLAQSAATNAKINPSQLTAADLSDGLSTFGQLTRAVEKAVDVIDILPRFKQMPHDTVDFTILCYINYIRGLQGIPLCEYEDIYKFYDERKAQYIKRLPFLEEDKTESNRESVRLFIQDEIEDSDTLEDGEE